MNWMVKNSRGDHDAMLSFACGGFIITALSILITLVESVTIGNHVVEIGNPDTTIIMAFLGATLLAYVTRRNNKDKYKHELEVKKLEQGILK